MDRREARRDHRAAPRAVHHALRHRRGGSPRGLRDHTDTSASSSLASGHGRGGRWRARLHTFAFVGLALTPASDGALIIPTTIHRDRRARRRATRELDATRSEEHTSELQSPYDLVCRLLLEKKK